jgi:hypothetical protein
MHLSSRMLNGKSKDYNFILILRFYLCNTLMLFWGMIGLSNSIL